MEQVSRIWFTPKQKVELWGRWSGARSPRRFPTCASAPKGRSICHKSACLSVSQRQAHAIVHETRRFAAPTSFRTARFCGPGANEFPILKRVTGCCLT